MALYPQEISMILSSDPANGAINRSANGASFEVQFDGDSLAIPRDALNVNVKLEESSIWWTIPNVSEGVNNKLYIDGSAEAEILTSLDLGFDVGDRISMLSGVGTALITISNTLGVDPPMPLGVFLVGDSIIFDSGPLTGNSYLISNILSDTTSNKQYEVTPSSDSLAVGVNSFSRYRVGAAASYVVNIPTGLYDLSGLNDAIQRELETLGAKTDPSPLISLSADAATQRVIVRFNYDDVSLDFTQALTFRDILGANAAVYGPYPTAAIDILLENTAAFNTINYFLIQADLVQKGIRINNVYNQTIGQVLIDVPPGSQIVSSPRHPAKVSAQELAGARRTNIRLRLTDDNGELVNTNNEFWSCRIVIEYLIKLV